MHRGSYRASYGRRKQRRRKWPIIAVILLTAAGYGVYRFVLPTPVEKAVSQLQFDASVTEAEKQVIRDAITNQQKTYSGKLDVSVTTTLEPDSDLILSAYVPVTGFYSPRLSVAGTELNAQMAQLPGVSGSAPAVDSTSVELIPVSELTDKIKLLALDGSYYLDNFDRGAVFREAVFSGDGAAALADLVLNQLPTKDIVLSFNQTGVTALTRQMMNRLRAVGGDATHFSAHIGEFLAASDITHVSNEVSFQTGCTIGDMLFCSPPAMIETLKASGVDVVELTGNHNNDVGAAANAETINLYHSLGWGTFGGGLNTAEAAKPWTTDQKGTKLALLGYNYPDSPNGGAIAGASKAGANSFDFDRIESDIKAAKDQGQFVIVDIQFWECYAYPDGYVEFPVCDQPIPNQAEVFRQVVSLGADMVVGSSAHQPQTYEIFQDKPIYYGLGNIYFDQVSWPGTERGLILTHYFIGGKLVQTRITPTVYDSDFQPAPMTEDDAVWLLDRLRAARP